MQHIKDFIKLVAFHEGPLLTFTTNCNANFLCSNIDDMY